ncbi:hypothetical protein [Aromatoleum buckelii]|uniref:Uncharacterized protein n=1 Tax=Aromatoleum buckelii TaxID=200254 RepID=A0ABX1N4Y8_9RHOO|nr:hypothetical protein [Aromatoleum buckelii]MCK0509728.1 hypothetical protein [Aromatoleum buckelii]
MARREVVHDSIRYTIADGDPPPADLSIWAVLRTRVIDELTLAPPANRIRLTTNLRRATVRIAEGGYCGLVARPRDVSAALVMPGALSASVEAAGYLPRDLTPAIDAARRALNAPANPGAASLDVLPPDTVPPLQFRPGRGVLLERTASIEAEQFTNVVSPPPAPATVPIADGPQVLRPSGTRVSGVPLALPTQPLHRAAPLALRVLMRRRSSPTSMVAATGAEIGIAGIWLAYPDTQTSPPVAGDFCAVEPGLRFAHPVGAPIHRCTLTASGAPRHLHELAPRGATSITVAPNAGLNPAGGDLLRLGDPLLPEVEIVVSAGFGPVADPNAAVTIRLTAPTAAIHRVTEPVSDLAVSAATPGGNVSREALPGDAVVFAAGIGALPTSSVIAIEHLTPHAAYYTATQYPAWDGVNFTHQTVLDANGRTVWPPLARIAQLRLFARRPPHPDQQLDFALEQMADNLVSIVFS